MNQPKMKPKPEDNKDKKKYGNGLANILKMIVIWVVVTSLSFPSIFFTAMEAPFSQPFFKIN